MTGGKVTQVLLILIIMISCLCTPALADIVVPTSTKVFFEKNGQACNDSVTFTVTCYGYIVDSTDPDLNNYWGGNYKQREPGTYEQTEVFSYSATVDHYGDEIFEPFYLNYRVVDYCSLCGETGGEEFFIENIGNSPISNCSLRDSRVIYERDSDRCYLATEQARDCYQNESRIRSQKIDGCGKYLEWFDDDRTYPPDTRMMKIGGVTRVVTQEYEDCINEAGSVDLNCTNFMPEVSCEDNCDPERNPIERDCELHYEIPVEGDEYRVEAAPETEEVSETEAVFVNETDVDDNRNEGFDPVSAILAFFGLV